MGGNSKKRRCYRFEEFELFPEERLLLRDGERLPQTPRIMDTLIMLVENHGQVVTKEALMEKLWPNSFVEENNINQAISAVRKSLGVQRNGSDFVETVPKSGYRFVVPVHEETLDVETQSSNQEFQVHRASSDRKLNYKTIVAVAGCLIVVLIAIGTAAKFLNADGTAPLRPKELGGGKRLTQSTENEQVAGWTPDGRILITRWNDLKTPETYAVNADGSGLVKATTLPDVRQVIWSPDGSKMIFWRYSDGGSNAYVAPADGIGSKKLPAAAENAAWSPDGSKIAFQSSSIGTKRLASTELLIYSVADGKLTEITANSNFDGDPGWSPDGSQLVFVSDRDGNFEIYSSRPDGTDVRRLTNNAGHDSFPKFSPDGTQIAFNSNIDRETTDIYIMNADGGDPVRLTNSKGNELSRSGWSPDGTMLAFNSDSDGNDEIYIMDVEPFNPVVLIEDPMADLQTPSYSPDGTKIVYTAEFGDKHSELRIYDNRTKSSTLLVNTSSPQNYPRWSPDGNWIAFHQEVNGKWDVFKVRPDGTDLTNLSNDPASDSIPTWSGDSSTIYFRSNRNGDTENSELFRMNADGSEQSALPIKKGKLGWGSVSPNGNEIAFASDRSGDPEKMFDIFVTDLTTGNERLVTSRSRNDTQPSFSNDGALVAFVAASDGNQEIYVTNADGSGVLRLTRNGANDINPAFSFDRSSIIFGSNRSGRAKIHEIVLRK